MLLQFALRGHQELFRAVDSGKSDLVSAVHDSKVTQSIFPNGLPRVIRFDWYSVRYS